MKLVGLLLLTFSLSATANEYINTTGMCTFEVTESDMFNSQEVRLPYEFKVNYIMSFERSSGTFLAIKKQILRDVNATTPVTDFELSEAANGIDFKKDNASEQLQVKMNLTGENVKTIAVYAGSYRAVYGDVSLPAVNTEYSAQRCGRVQSHLPPSENSGLSYHVQWCCNETSGSIPTPGPTNPGPTNPEPTNPGQTYPGECTQNGMPVPCPGQTNPGQTNPGQTNPGQTNPGQTYPGQSGCYQAGRQVPCPIN